MHTSCDKYEEQKEDLNENSDEEREQGGKNRLMEEVLNRDQIPERETSKEWTEAEHKALADDIVKSGEIPKALKEALNNGLGPGINIEKLNELLHEKGMKLSLEPMRTGLKLSLEQDGKIVDVEVAKSDAARESARRILDPTPARGAEPKIEIRANPLFMPELPPRQSNVEDSGKTKPGSRNSDKITDNQTDSRSSQLPPFFLEHRMPFVGSPGDSPPGGGSSGRASGPHGGASSEGGDDGRHGATGRASGPHGDAGSAGGDAGQHGGGSSGDCDPPGGASGNLDGGDLHSDDDSGDLNGGDLHSDDDGGDLDGGDLHSDDDSGDLDGGEGPGDVLRKILETEKEENAIKEAARKAIEDSLKKFEHENNPLSQVVPELVTPQQLNKFDAEVSKEESENVEIVARLVAQAVAKAAVAATAGHVVGAAAGAAFDHVAPNALQTVKNLKALWRDRPEVRKR